MEKRFMLNVDEVLVTIMRAQFSPDFIAQILNEENRDIKNRIYLTELELECHKRGLELAPKSQNASVASDVSQVKSLLGKLIEKIKG